MLLKPYIPSAPLQPFIQAYKIIESQDARVNRVLPDTTPAIAFRYKGRINYLSDQQANPVPAAVISGLRSSVRLINYQENTAAIIVQFKPAGAAAFFKTPLHELFEHSVSLDNFISRQQTAIIEEQLAEAKTTHERITVIETLLLSLLHGSKQDNLILNVLQQIQTTQGDLPIKNLAASNYLSQDAFEKRFRKTIGTSPKQYASIIRLKSLITRKQPTQSLTDLALDAGYFDQAHFNKSFKRFTGLTPSHFFQSPLFW
ncbi:helix-turn-helix domain-containing protein [Chitinophaga sp. HK235]|uniref:helix-turn-helix domain-containing protein n=1 Tax=Chitinophaga sp. HK235 TaxID=2952571 RepID=UPI002011C7F3|nr:helix-turn-helix domain-containing protein [Chitinophaga sp. HK235]